MEKSNLVAGSVELTKIFQEYGRILYPKNTLQDVVDNEFDAYMNRQIKMYKDISAKDALLVVNAVTAAKNVGVMNGIHEIKSAFINDIRNKKS